MPWQDAVIAVGQMLFAFALVPALINPSKPPRSTCYTTAAVLFAFAATFATLGFYFSVAMNLVTGLLWLRLGMQHRAPIYVPRPCAWYACLELTEPGEAYCKTHRGIQ